jgi:hypothetical protein
MKKIIFTLIALAAVTVLDGCSATKTAEELSWQAFCQARGYELSDQSADVVNEYLDTWRGTAAEEAALDAANVQPF